MTQSEICFKWGALYAFNRPSLPGWLEGSWAFCVHTTQDYKHYAMNVFDNVKISCSFVLRTPLYFTWCLSFPFEKKVPKYKRLANTFGLAGDLINFINNVPQNRTEASIWATFTFRHVNSRCCYYDFEQTRVVINTKRKSTDVFV